VSGGPGRKYGGGFVALRVEQTACGRQSGSHNGVGVRRWSCCERNGRVAEQGGNGFGGPEGAATLWVGRRLLGRGLRLIRVGINSRRFDRQACKMTVAQAHGAMLEGGMQEQKKSGVPQVKERVRGSE
jgi:hypothetical protein